MKRTPFNKASLTQAFARGRSDARRNVSRGACPYKDVAMEMAWSRGWDFEQRMRRKAQ